MNEQLQAALTKLIEQISSGAATASAQLPEALQQYVAYSRESSVKMMAICFGIAGFFIFTTFVSWLFNRNYGEVAFIRFFMVIFAAIAVVFGVVYYNQYIQTFYPQAFILDLLRGMVSK